MKQILLITALLIGMISNAQITIKNNSYSEVCVTVQDCGGYPVAKLKIPAYKEVTVNVDVASCGKVKYGTGYSCDT